MRSVSNHLAWTPPSEIDGEPTEVAELVTQQLVDLATVVAVEAAEAYIQLRAEGLEHVETLEEWEASPAGTGAEQVRASGVRFASSIRDLASR